jgi:type IX secretion system PorP/SprF family membrane protein
MGKKGFVELDMNPVKIKGMKKIIISFLLALCFGTAVNAQQDAEYNMYLFNGLYINPAYAGSQGVLSAMAIYRQQWAGLDGAPMTVNASVNSPLKKRDQYALGLTLSNDRLGFTNMFSATGAFAYRIKIKNGNVIALGVQAGATYYQQRSRDAFTGDNNYDPAFSVNTNLWLPNVGLGIYAYGKRYFAGFSVPHMIPFSLDTKWKLQTSDAVAHEYNYYLLTAGYVFGKDIAKVKFRPSFLMKYQRGLPFNVPNFDFNLGFLFVDRVWLIAGVRTGGEAYSVLGNTKETVQPKPFNIEGVIGTIHAKITHQFSIGYSYRYSLSQIRKYETGTHEVMLGYEFAYDKKRFVTPRFVSYF